uniref:Uncharacterized protein n=1 Tax=Acrobeloides nanus TaxID=290746 RepID=A0A914CFA5_9BILA
MIHQCCSIFLCLMLIFRLSGSYVIYSLREADPDPELTKLSKAFEAMTKLCKTRFSSTSAPSHGTGTTLISELCGELRPKIA